MEVYASSQSSLTVNQVRTVHRCESYLFHQGVNMMIQDDQIVDILDNILKRLQRIEITVRHSEPTDPPNHDKYLPTGRCELIIRDLKNER